MATLPRSTNKDKSEPMLAKSVAERATIGDKTACPFSMRVLVICPTSKAGSLTVTPTRTAMLSDGRCTTVKISSRNTSPWGMSTAATTTSTKPTIRSSVWPSGVSSACCSPSAACPSSPSSCWATLASGSIWGKPGEVVERPRPGDKANKEARKIPPTRGTQLPTSMFLRENRLVNSLIAETLSIIPSYRWELHHPHLNHAFYGVVAPVSPIASGVGVMVTINSGLLAVDSTFWNMLSPVLMI